MLSAASRPPNQPKPPQSNIMKLINKMAVAAVLALSSAGLASAQTIIHVTGSTAYRVADVTAECSYLGTGTTAVTFKNVSSGTGQAALTSANYSIIYGPGSGAGQTIFENYFNGSIAGDEALVDGVTKLNFAKASTYASSASAVTQGNSTTAAVITTPTTTNEQPNYTTFDSASPDVAFSDVTFATADQIIKASSDSTNTQPANSAIVGIVPFDFVINGTSDVTDLAGLNMDPQKFTYTWQSQGSCLLSFYTGLNADEATTVYPMGRDVDSGTRATALAETGYGLTGSGIVTSPVYQYYAFDTQAHDTADQNTANANIANGFSATTGVVGDDSGATSIGVIDFVPQETIDGYTMTTGDGGYYSGGNLSTAISTGFSGLTNTVLVTYLGVSDATAALVPSGGTNRQAAKIMAYNGVTFYPTSSLYPTGTTTATNAAKIYEGQYTFWGYEHEFYTNGTGVATAASGVASKLNGGIDQLSSNGVTFGSMNVSRGGDGQNIQ